MRKYNSLTRLAEKLVEEFLQKASNLKGKIELIKVLKARVYQISKANVLIRGASDGNRNYFYGINYITIEEMANLLNPYIAFVCGSIDKVIILPALAKIIKEFEVKSIDMKNKVYLRKYKTLIEQPESYGRIFLKPLLVIQKVLEEDFDSSVAIEENGGTSFKDSIITELKID